MRIGIDLGGTKIEGIMMDDSGGIVKRKRVTTPPRKEYEQILYTIGDLVTDLETSLGTGSEQRYRVGIGTPGSLSAANQTLKNSNTLSLNGKPVKLDLENLLQREIRVENDANCFALSEAMDGAAAGRNVVFGVILGTGVGGGIVIGRRLHQGPQHIAGEWGHNILIPNGRPCYCGRRGCVETYLSGPGLVAEWQHLSGRGTITTAEEIIAGTLCNDDLCQSAMDRYLDYFGRALSAVINILDPDAIVLGGGMSNLQDLYTEGVHRISKHVFNDEFTTPIVPNLHGDSSGVRGAAWLWPTPVAPCQ